jgi:hypothetical protein
MNASDVLGKGRTALVTGASRGIGPLIAAEIARQGGHVVLTGRSTADLQAVTAELATAGADVSLIPADLTEPGAAEALAQAVERQHGGIDLLINNAGGDPLREFHTMTIEENLRTSSRWRPQSSSTPSAATGNPSDSSSSRPSPPTPAAPTGKAGPPRSKRSCPPCRFARPIDRRVAVFGRCRTSKYVWPCWRPRSRREERALVMVDLGRRRVEFFDRRRWGARKALWFPHIWA